MIGETGWQRRAVAGVVHWWALFLMGGTLGGIAFDLIAGAADFYAFHTAIIVDACAQALYVAAAVAAVLVVRQASRRQEQRAVALGLIRA